MKAAIRKAISMTPEERRERKQAKIEKKRKDLAAGVPRDARGRILPGNTLNSLGRPKMALSVLCREQVSKLHLIRVLGAIASRSGDYANKKRVELTVSDQIGAIKLLLLYGYGVPKNEIDSGNVKIEVSYSDNRQVKVLNVAGKGDDTADVRQLEN